MSEPRVVIVGGGFGGLQATKSLRRAPVQVTLVDRRNHHLFQPLLYQVATGGLSPANIAAPLRVILHRQQNCDVILAEVTGIDVEKRQLKLSDGELSYDILVIAAGSRHSYFGRDIWAKLAPGLKSIEDATEIRKNFLCAFEAAERITDPVERDAWLTFVIVGGGPTGVEMAGTISEIARYTLPKNFRHVRPEQARVILVKAHEHVLGAYPSDLAARATASLEKKGVTVYTHSRVVEITDEHVVMMQGEKQLLIPARTVIWAAGVQVSPLANMLEEKAGAELDKQGRVLVGTDLSLANHPEIFVIGDMCHFTDPSGQVLPGLAPVAMQQGMHVARVIQHRLANRSTSPFQYKDRGTMATIGRSAAVAEIGKWKFSGSIAWLMWLFIHVTQIVQFESRILVLLQWMWNYFTFSKSALLITHEKNRFCNGINKSRNPPPTPPLNNTREMGRLNSWRCPSRSQHEAPTSQDSR